MTASVVGVLQCVCAENLQGLKLKKEQEQAVLVLLENKDLFAILPTDFGKNIIYQTIVKRTWQILVPRAMGFLNGISSGLGNSKKIWCFWLADENCMRNKVKKLSTSTHCIWLPDSILPEEQNLQLLRAFPSDCVQYRNMATTPTKSVFKFPGRHVTFNRDISYNCYPILVLVKQLKKQASLKMLQE